ncbi:MAG TPA: glutaminyl-peptide cyclotransferase [Gaiellaceae bacterium]|jgi:streptogramin lyase
MRLLALLVVAGGVAAAAAGAVRAPMVVAKIKVAPSAAPCATAAAGGSVWVSEYGSPYLLRIDPKTNKVVSKTRIGFGSCGLGAGDGSLWVEDTSSGTLSRVSVKTRKRTAIPVGSQPYDATFAYGAAWVTSYGNSDVERVDPARNKVVKRFPLELATGVVGAFGSVWAAGGNTVLRIDPATNRVVAKVPVEGAGWTAASDDAVWITAPGVLVRIDPKTNTVAATIPIHVPALGDPSVVGGMVWVPEIRQNAIALVDPSTNRVSGTVKVGAGPFVVTEIAGQAWVPSWKGADIWRIAPR